MALAISVTGCSASSTRHDTASKYAQTWDKQYSDTTCDDWHGMMTQKQRWVAAADMLAGARNKGDGGTGLPSDELVHDFQGAITRACIVATSPITEIAVGVYLTEPRYAPDY